ncbi:MAG: flavin reductase family protein [Rothia sp. (in: high G+C Gram-positive bacteria)]|uniref:flavin reductase family protein n=1 Tax=Rothia sp. (in: high G+C Gram-positive bacteria) TaxID=1885016 RepID=UPI00270BD98A|nr:flavin reductase family protein [Rothia sp. (in: high G+C Gram-positive bacteria)]
MTETKLDPHNLRDTFSAYPTGIALTAGHLNGTPAGMLTNSFSTVSLDPPLISISFAKTSTTWPTLQQLPQLGVSVLAADDLETANLLRRATQDRFNDVTYTAHDGGALTLPGAAAHLIVEPHDTIEAGDHIIALYRALDHHRASDAQPLVFHNSSIRPLAA